MNTLKALASGSSLIAMLAAAATPTMSLGETLAEIEAAAKAEGMLTTIALPHDWCNYGEIIASFKAKYPEITVNELNPDAGSADELEAIRANKDNTGPQAPDVIDVGLAFGPQAKEEGLIQPYKVSVWDDISADIKDAEKIAAHTKAYEDRFLSPFVAAERGYIDEVIMPHSTRRRIAVGLRKLRTKKLENPWKKHDNIPL